MFNGSGRSIQTFAIIIYAFCIFICILGGIFAITNGYGVEALGFFVLWLISTISCLCLYGFGKIIENTDKIANSLNGDKGKNGQEEKLRKLDYWKEWNLITDKEYEILKNRLTSPEDMLYTVKKKYDDGEITEQQYKDMRIKIFNSLCK